MKFLHISDLHIGKYVNGYRMLDDQRYMLERIVEIIKEKNPDALLIAGDIYDKSLPSAEAVELFNRFMTEIAGLHGKTGLKTFVISGNHDSPERIGYFNKLIELNGIFTDGVFEGVARKNTVECDGERVNIFSLPFIRPSFVRNVYPYESSKIPYYTTAVRVVFEHSDINADETNILIAHQFVTGSETSGSESSLGTLDNVEPYVFEPFDYVALGHIHGKQIMGKNKNIAYPPAFFRNQIDGTGQQNLAVNILALACRLGEMITDIAHIGSAQQRIANGMNQDIGIRMPQQS